MFHSWPREVYRLAEILGEKYVGGERVWGGIRGGVREVAYSGSDSFELRVKLGFSPVYRPGLIGHYIQGNAPSPRGPVVADPGWGVLRSPVPQCANGSAGKSASRASVSASRRKDWSSSEWIDPGRVICS
jgi:hypothetical protein